MSDANNQPNGTDEVHGRVARSSASAPSAVETTMNGMDAGQPSGPVVDPVAPAASQAASPAAMGASPRVEGHASRRRSSVPRARRMKLSLTKIDPWSVTKVSFLLSVALMIIQIVAVLLIWLLLDSIGVFSNFDSIVSSTGLSSDNNTIASILSLPTVLSVTTILSIFETVLLTALATIGAFLYNIVSALVGGVHVTLGDD